MGKRPKRQIVLFLVEGKSDRKALQLAIPELYDRIDENIEVFFPTMVEDEEEKGGDITSKIQVWPRNIEEKIYELFLKNFFDEQKIMPKDITEIVQIVDMDPLLCANFPDRYAIQCVVCIQCPTDRPADSQPEK